MLPRVAILYGQGTASVQEIKRDLIGEFEPVLVLPPGSKLMTRWASGARIRCVPWEGVATTSTSLRLLGIDGITTFCEHNLKAASLLSRTLGLPGNAARAAHATTNKAAQRRLLQGKGSAHVTYRLAWSQQTVAAAATAIGLPVVVKPVFGTGSAGVHIVRSMDDIANLAHLTQSRRLVLVEEYLSGDSSQRRGPLADYVSVETASLNGSHTQLAIVRKLPVVQGVRETAHVLPSASTTEDRAISQFVTTCLDEIGITHGISHTEIKLGANGPRLIEVNGRLGGFIRDVILPATGVSPILQAVRVAVGDQPLNAQRPKNRCYFAFTNLAPAADLTLTASHGHKIVRRAAEISDARLVAAPPRTFRRGTGTNELDVVAGNCQSVNEVRSTIRGHLAHISFTFRTMQDETMVYRAKDLPSYGALTVPMISDAGGVL